MKIMPQTNPAADAGVEQQIVSAVLAKAGRHYSLMNEKWIYLENGAGEGIRTNPTTN
ncbi:hypothetical protein [Enterobacter pasteurii]